MSDNLNNLNGRHATDSTRSERSENGAIPNKSSSKNASKNSGHLANKQSGTGSSLKQQIDEVNKRAFIFRGKNVARSMLLAQRAYDLASKGVFVKNPYEKGIVESLLTLGYGHLHHYDYHLARTNAIEAQGYCESDEHHADCYMLLGVSYSGLGTYDKALKHLLEAMHYTQTNESLKGDILAHLGKVYSHFGDADEALKSLKEALAIKQSSKSTQDKLSLSETWNSLARVYLQLGYEAQALIAAQRSLDIARSLNDVNAQAQPYISCGLIHLALDDFDQAITHLTSALTIAREQENRLAKLHALRGVSEVYLVQGDYHLVGQFAADALKIADFLDSSAEQYECHKLYAEYYEAVGNLAKALEHSKRAQAYKTKVFDIKLDQHIRTVELMHETQSAKHRAEIYQLKHVELQKQYEELKGLNARVSWLSQHDDLTGLFNRRYFNEQLELAFGRHRRYENNFCVALLDVEQLTLINKRYSQSVGDAVLEKVASTLQAATRDVDLVARYGSDEFMILFPELRIEQAVAACKRIQAYIKNMDWLGVVEESIEDNALPIPVSINMAILSCEGINNIEAMILKLDQQLQEGKKKV